MKVVVQRFVRFTATHFITSQPYLNLLEGAVNHGDEHVEQHYHHGDVVHPVEHVTNVLDELVPVVDHHRPDLGQSEYGPEQRLKALLQAR